MDNQTSAAIYVIISGLIFTITFGSPYVINSDDELIIILFAGLGMVVSGLILLFGVYYDSRKKASS
ncbi:hypothetical protein GRX03_13420 [Halovenus sp. WSH3]|uniref:Uncharacterized protein n=1 Tax=Halovenus carboxidivorans TaxID=2692199 RepID=A0A6B0TBJ5_9EURY|nr:hypothetical protein [Halovenus carboxidivorans]MXR52601.1 hypothetical protein [Halovenus carboxidivorans]